MIIKRSRLALLLLMAPVLAIAAQETKAPAKIPTTPRPASTPADLFQAVAEQDAAVFDAYNTCNLKKFDSFFVPDVEFYHDHGGVTLGNKALTESIKKNICGKTTRELIPESLEVYPMDNYGALEIGVHRFHHPGHEQTEPVGEGKFVMLWHYDRETKAWKITRVISFDHHEVK